MANNSLTKIFFYIISVIVLSLVMVQPMRARTIPSNVVWSHLTNAYVNGIDWSPTGDQIAFGSNSGDQISAVNWRTGEILWNFSIPSGHGNWYLSPFQWSPSGQFIVYIAEHKVYVIDMRNGQPSQMDRSTFGHEDRAYSNVRWNSDSTALAAIDSDGYIDILLFETGEIAQTIDLGIARRGEGTVYQLFDWSPDGAFYSSPYYPSTMAHIALGFWDRNGQLVDEYSKEKSTSSPLSTACSVYADGLIQVNDLQWANDSRTIAIAGSDGYGICQLNIDGTVTNHQISETNAGVKNLRWSPNQRWLAAAHELDFGRESLCQVLISDAANDYATVEEKIEPQPCYVDTLTWSADSQHLAVSTDRGLWIGTFVSS